VVTPPGAFDERSLIHLRSEASVRVPPGLGAD
jgi:hypothetical protein